MCERAREHMFVSRCVLMLRKHLIIIIIKYLTLEMGKMTWYPRFMFGLDDGDTIVEKICIRLVDAFLRTIASNSQIRYRRLFFFSLFC